MLKYKNIKIIDVGDWDAFIIKTYNRPYAFQQQDGYKERGIFYFTVPCIPLDFENDSIEEDLHSNEIGVSFKSWLSRNPSATVNNNNNKTIIELFWLRNFYPDIYTLANDLHNKGLLESGNYAIDINW